MACSTNNILQWNCRGLRSRREEIEILITKYTPAVLCIQETMLKANNQQQQSFKSYSAYYSSTDNGSGGVGILVKNTHLHRKLPLVSNLQAIAVSVTIGKKAYSICSVYIPPCYNLQLQDLDDIKNQLPGPVIFMGDFNAHNPFWGCSYTNTKGKLVEEFIVENDLIIFNPGESTGCQWTPCLLTDGLTCAHNPWRWACWADGPEVA